MTKTRYTNSPPQSKHFRSTAARLNPSRTAPPARTLTQCEFIVDALRKVKAEHGDDAGISKAEFKDGTHPLLNGRRIFEVQARIRDLHLKGYLIEHVLDADGFVSYVLRGCPSDPAEVQRPTKPGWKSQPFHYGNKPPQSEPDPQQSLFTATRLQYEMGVRR